MLNVFWTGSILVLAKLLAYVAESRYHYLPKLAAALGVPLDISGNSPVFAVLLVGIVFIAVGVFTNSKSLILMPLVLCAAEVSVLSPMLGVRGIPAIASFGQVQILSTALAIVGALVLMDSNNVHRLRAGRVGVALRLIFALEIANVGMYAFLTLSPNLGVPLMVIANVVCFAIILWISARANTCRAIDDQVHADAELVPGLNKEVGELTAERDEALDERDSAEAREDLLKGQLLERNKTIDTLVEELKVARNPGLRAAA